MFSLDLAARHCAVQLCRDQQGQRAEHLHTGQELAVCAPDIVTWLIVPGELRRERDLADPGDVRQ